MTTREGGYHKFMRINKKGNCHDEITVTLVNQFTQHTMRFACGRGEAMGVMCQWNARRAAVTPRLQYPDGDSGTER